MTDIVMVTEAELKWLEKHAFQKDSWEGWVRKCGDVETCLYKVGPKWRCNGSENDLEMEAATPRLALKAFHDVHVMVAKASKP
jgi:hypothetical protein